MSNVVRIEELRLLQVEKEKTERQGAKKVSVDDGFIQIPRELYLAIAKFPFTKHQRAVIDAVIIKCLGYHKEMDWIGNGQIVDLTSIGYECKASTAKQELIRMNVLVQKGSSIGFNLVISEWKNSDLPKQEKIYRNSKNKFTETVNGDLPKQENTKETITKEKINTPHTPQGENGELAGNDIFDVEQSSLDEKNSYAEQAESALAYYNEISKSHCRDNTPFLKILEPQKSRKGWTLDEIKLVIRWVFATWRTHNAPKPQNICRVTRFDGYLSDAVNWVETQGDLNFDDVIEAFNRIFEHRYEPVELNIITKRNILNLLPHLKNKSIDGFENYFNFYNETVSEYYDKFGFSFVMKPETLQKVREGALQWLPKL